MNDSERIEFLLGLIDDHVTIMKFTTHWKVMIGTPDLDGRGGRNQVRALRPGTTMYQALLFAIQDKVNDER